MPEMALHVFVAGFSAHCSRRSGGCTEQEIVRQGEGMGLDDAPWLRIRGGDSMGIGDQRIRGVEYVGIGAQRQSWRGTHVPCTENGGLRSHTFFGAAGVNLRSENRRFGLPVRVDGSKHNKKCMSLHRTGCTIPPPTMLSRKAAISRPEPQSGL